MVKIQSQNGNICFLEVTLSKNSFFNKPNISTLTKSMNLDISGGVIPRFFYIQGGDASKIFEKCESLFS